MDDPHQRPAPRRATQALALCLALGCSTGVPAVSEDAAPPADGPLADTPRFDAGTQPRDAGADTGTQPRDAGADTGFPDLQPQDRGPMPPTWTEPYGVLSLNLHCLRLDSTRFRSHEERFRAVAAAVAAEDVAVLLLQEACERGSTSGLAMLAAEVERATGRAWSRGWVFAHMAWEGTPDEAREGVGLLVRGAVAPQAFRPYRYHVQRGLERLALSATLPPELGSLRVSSVHLSYESTTAREAQARETASALLSAAHPSLDVLVGGDFNDREGSPTHAAMGAWGYRDLTAGIAPTRRIDHVFVHRGADVERREARVIFDGTSGPRVSDHDGYLVRIAPGNGERVAPTVFEARANVGVGHWVTVRGDTAPLAWTRGWTAWPADDATWRLVATELPARALEYKFLRDDTAWQVGPNSTGTGGEALRSAPQLPP